jgi:hypothetical protein
MELTNYTYSVIIGDESFSYDIANKKIYYGNKWRDILRDEDGDTYILFNDRKRYFKINL